MKLPYRSFPIIAALFLCISPLLFGQEHPLVIPPQFLTLPIVSRTTATTLVNGHQIFVPTVANEKITNTPPSGAPPGGGGGHGGGNPPPPDFGNPGAVLPANVSCFANSANNVDATCAADSYQGEPMLMNSPGTTTVSGGLFGAENDIYPGNCSASAADGAFGDCGLSATYSANGGATWQRFKINRSWGGHNYLIDFDPSVAVDSQGRTFVAFGFSDSSGPNGMGAVMGVPDTLTPGGVRWTKTNPISLNGGSTFDDKMWIAADATTGSSLTDRLYLAWDRNKSNNQILEVSTSSNGGQTWTAPVKINDGTTKFERVIYAFPAVAPNHTVYVLWLDYAKNIIFMDKSGNGGATWGTDVAVASTHIGFGSDIGCNGGRSMAPAPQMAISSGGTIYVVYADQPAGPGNNYNVYLTKSTNAAATWSAPVLVTSASGHQYNPSIAVDSSGTVQVSYLDRRNDASNCRTDTFLSTSSNSGVSFADTKVTDVDSDFDGNPNGPGDYSGITTSGTTAHPYFADHRDANATNDGNSGTIDGGFEIYTADIP
jgi:hypothetical protein